jgi:small-conductance mechanosensitive channel
MENTNIIEALSSFLPSVIGIALVITLVIFVDWLTKRHYAQHHKHRYRQQLITLSIFFAGLIVVIIVLPISDSLRGQLLSLIGIIVSATIALSSTTFVGNAMAGIMLRSLRSFKIGDFVRVGEYFGRVSEMGLLHVEIQTEDRDLMTVPNLYIVNQPTKVIHASGTIISAQCSLGYDVPRTNIETVLLEAAKATDLEDPYILLIELGDFAVTYQVNGLLREVKQLISVRSSLRNNMLDALHKANIEIVSPSYMNTRAYPIEHSFIPPVIKEAKTTPAAKTAKPEDMVFDKAEEAESLENTRLEKDELLVLIKELEESLKKTEAPEQQRRMNAELKAIKYRVERLNKVIVNAEKKATQERS